MTIPQPETGFLSLFPFQAVNIFVYMHGININTESLVTYLGLRVCDPL